MHKIKEQVDYEQVCVDIKIYNEDIDIAECDCEVCFTELTVDDSFEHEFGIRKESHIEIINEQSSIDEILENFIYHINTETVRMLVKGIVEKLVEDYMTNDQQCIFAEIDIMDYITKGAIR
jgi:hypothetical protein